MSSPDINTTPLHNAFTCDGTMEDVEVMRARLLADPDALFRKDRGIYMHASPLHSAVTTGHENCVRFLLQSGANVNTIEDNSDRDTPVFAAIFNGYNKILELLLSHGAMPNCPSPKMTRNTYFYITCLSYNCVATRLLLEHGADTEDFMIVPEEVTPLFFIAGDDHLECMKQLLLHGAIADLNNLDNPTVSQTHQMPIIHKAVVQGTGTIDDKLNTIELLCEFGVNPWRKDKISGETALDFLKRKAPNHEHLDVLSEKLKEKMSHPLTLQSLARLKIKSSIAKKTYLHNIQSLSLPSRLISFLEFSEFGDQEEAERNLMKPMLSQKAQ